ncbi:MAG: D-tyrosyl-tRNA(Tyr) deacylase [Candidatus Marinimicrobia bacterium]|nr:D-tyrosyl-tRNA(Tyr) deacylase [Candidatus Neomarinimicrobiota bacterium]
MIAVLQRVQQSKVVIEGKTVGKIESGLNILIGVYKNDNKIDVEFLAKKISSFRIFPDKNHNMNLSIQDVNGSALVISQFTLCADWRNGNRPGFPLAAKPGKANELYELFINELESYGIIVQSGRFGSMMDVYILNDGPVTFVLNSKEK